MSLFGENRERAVIFEGLHFEGEMICALFLDI